jgi:outer membrane lipoprotein carrier protein
MKLSLALAIVLASPIAGTSTNAPEVSSLVHKFEARYRSAHTLRATFLERYLDSGKEVRAEAGTAFFRKPGKMRWEYASPEPNLYVIDGKWSWFYVPADHTVTRIRTKESSDWRTPLALLAGEVKVLRVCQSVVLDRSAPPVDPNGVVLRCNLAGTDDAEQVGRKAETPDLRSGRRFALFELDPASGELLRVLVVDPGGVQVEFRFANWQFDPPLDDTKFRFAPPKGVAIVEGDLGSPRAGSSHTAAP